MHVIGIEGTAHTAGVGIVEYGPDTADGAYTVLANPMDLYSPAEGGIHPREAANHHARELPLLIERALDEGGLRAADIDLVAFSQGPGLGPCLRTAATAARMLALSLHRPLIGVNHCVAHLEVGRLLGATDPILLYASGGNTQIIAYTNGRYRVFGETLDIGVGNMLDKFGLRLKMRFPPGPMVEQEARKGAQYSPLPYSVKGMDLAFSGILTAALERHRRGDPVPDICFSLQETVFAMLTEVTERAMAHTEKDEVLLGGGVVQNKRLQAMVRQMAEDRDARFYVPPPALCRDNGAMIALTGLLMHQSGIRQPIQGTVVKQRFRTDAVDVSWREERSLGRDLAPTKTPWEERSGTLWHRGAEAEIHRITWRSRPAVAKRRVPKRYRLRALDEKLRTQRARHECRLISEARRVGIRTPIVYDLDIFDAEIVMEYIDGPRVKSVLLDSADTGSGPAAENGDHDIRALCRRIGATIGALHAADIVHGDLTTSNILLKERDGPVVLIDLGLGEKTDSVEAKGVDLHVLMEAFESTHSTQLALLDDLIAGYRKTNADADTVLDRVQDIERRGRYIKRPTV